MYSFVFRIITSRSDSCFSRGFFPSPSSKDATASGTGTGSGSEVARATSVSVKGEVIGNRSLKDASGSAGASEKETWNQVSRSLLVVVQGYAEVEPHLYDRQHNFITGNRSISRQKPTRACHINRLYISKMPLRP